MFIRPATLDDADACAFVMSLAMSVSDDYNRPDLDEILPHWQFRVSGYMAGTYHPGFSREERVVYVAEESSSILGFIAGHRTMRFGCDGELQWAFVLPDYQRRGVSSSLLSSLRQWFVDHGMRKVCVNASSDMATRAFYMKHGATPMNEHWCNWDDIGNVKC